MRKQNFFILLLQIGIISCGVSISISQSFLFLSFLVFWFLPEKRTLRLSSLFWLGLGIFSIYLLSLLANLSFENLKGFFSRQSEFKDILLLSAFLVTHNLSEKEQVKIQQAFHILIILLILTGFISIFSHVRLSVMLNELLREVKHWRYTHGYGEVFGISIHLPIGLMNTHLTFGGLLLLFAPYVFFRTLRVFQEQENILKKILFIFGLILFMLVFVLNNARSAMFGTIVAFIFGGYDYFINRKEIEFKKFLKYSSLLIFGVVLIFLVLLSVETTSKTVRYLVGSEKHTDSGRTFIWDSTYPIIQENFWFGVGAGNYNKAIEKTRFERSNQNPELAYFYEVTQRGHAHNDYLHLWSVAGIFSVILYLSLFYVVMNSILSKNLKVQESIFFYGLVGFFFAGLFQCYFQDDEVVIVFWYLVGFLNAKLKFFV